MHLRLLLFRALALFWCLQIFMASSESFASTRTSGWLIPLLSRLIPGLSPSTLGDAHLLLRKSAHVVEYGILALLVFFSLAPSAESGHRSRANAAWTFALCAAYALTDELHQCFVAGRGPSPVDWLLDCLGAAAAVLACWMIQPRSRIALRS